MIASIKMIIYEEEDNGNLLNTFVEHIFHTIDKKFKAR